MLNEKLEKVCVLLDKRQINVKSRKCKIDNSQVFVLWLNPLLDLEDIAKIANISCVRVQQIVSKGIRLLRYKNDNDLSINMIRYKIRREYYAKK